jgi:hypothetical protein
MPIITGVGSLIADWSQTVLADSRCQPGTYISLAMKKNQGKEGAE